MYMAYVQDLLKFEMSIRMRKEDDISDSDCGMEKSVPECTAKLENRRLENIAYLSLGFC